MRFPGHDHSRMGCLGCQHALLGHRAVAGLRLGVAERNAALAAASQRRHAARRSRRLAGLRRRASQLFGVLCWSGRGVLGLAQLTSGLVISACRPHDRLLACRLFAVGRGSSDLHQGAWGQAQSRAPI